MQSSNFPTIGTVVAYALDELQLQHRASELRETFAQKAIRVLRTLNLFFTETLGVAYLQVNEMNAVDLPLDYIDYTKIALYINGRLWTLTLREDIALPRAEECGVSIRMICNSGGLVGTGGINDGIFFADHWHNGKFIGGLYGLGGGFNTAYYRIDEQRNQIIFDGVIPRCQVVLEYRSNGLSPNSTTYIRQQWIEPMVAYLVWKHTEADPKASEARKQRMQDNYEQQVIMMTNFETSITADEFRDAIYRSFKLSPKR